MDGVVSVVDATEIIKANVDLIILTNEQKALANHDGNGVINVMDATSIQKMIAGI